MHGVAIRDNDNRRARLSKSPQSDRRSHLQLGQATLLLSRSPSCVAARELGTGECCFEPPSHASSSGAITSDAQPDGVARGPASDSRRLLHPRRTQHQVGRDETTLGLAGSGPPREVAGVGARPPSRKLTADRLQRPSATRSTSDPERRASLPRSAFAAAGGLIAAADSRRVRDARRHPRPQVTGNYVVRRRADRCATPMPLPALGRTVKLRTRPSAAA